MKTHEEVLTAALAGVVGAKNVWPVIQRPDAVGVFTFPAVVYTRRQTTGDDTFDGEAENGVEFQIDVRAATLVDIIETAAEVLRALKASERVVSRQILFDDYDTDAKAFRRIISAVLR